jgi:hypothetical protein
MGTLKIAQNYVSLGFSLLPVHPATHPDKEQRKKPVTSLLPSGQWTPLQQRKPTDVELSAWFGSNGHALALIGGAVSGGLACVDIDTKADITGHLLEDLEELFSLENQDLYNKLVRQKTISGGQHWLFRTQQKIGNNALACRKGDIAKAEKPKIKLIETKSEGGYFLIAPSNGYCFLSGDLSTIPILTSEEVETIFSIARSLDQFPQEHKTYTPAQREFKANDLSPWNDYNQRASIADILQCLEGAGWTAFQKSAGYRLRRPGAERGTHASLNLISALPFFHCFTDSAAPFEGGKTYAPFAVMSFCQYGGDFSKAAKNIFAKGYGRQNGKAQKEATTEPVKIDFETRVYIPTWDNCPADIQPLMELSNVRILSRGNLAMITACAGAGKSSVMEAACASILSPMADALGLCVNAKKLLYVDTERSRFDHNHSWQRFLRRSGIEPGGAVPVSVTWENVKAIESLCDRLSYLWSRLDAENVPEIVLLDGIGDFCADPNDSDECTALVYRLGSIADTRNIGIMLSLHNNPAMNSVKARGVLGSELWRKSESVLIIEKTPGDDIRRLTTDYTLGKNRGGSDAISSYFKWDNEQKMHVSCAAPAEAKGKTACEREKILEHIGTRSVWSFTDLQVAIMDITGKSERAARYKISDLIALKKLNKNNNSTYSLAGENHAESPDYIHE